MFVTFLHILKGFRKHIGEVSLGNGIGNPFADTVNYLFFYLFKQIINIQEIFIEGYTVVARPAGELRNGDFSTGLVLYISQNASMKAFLVALAVGDSFTIIITISFYFYDRSAQSVGCIFRRAEYIINYTTVVGKIQAVSYIQKNY